MVKRKKVVKIYLAGPIFKQVPLIGLGIGQQMAWYNNKVTEEERH